MINPIHNVASAMPTDTAIKANTTSGFQEILRDALARVEASRAAADGAVEDFISGDNQDLHSTIMATQKASLEFEYMLQVRNKVVQSYQEIMRMQL